MSIWVSSLGEAKRASLQELVMAARAADGISPLNESGRYALDTNTGAEWLLAVAADGEIQGFAQVSKATSKPVEAQLVVHPRSRNLGVGTALVSTLKNRFPHGAAWSFGILAPAARLAAATALSLSRELLVMERDLLLHPADEAATDPSITVVPYRDQDAEELVAVNALAFAHHPEQGAMSVAEVRRKTGGPGFDPSGLLLAKDVANSNLVGFHWTKVHGPGSDRPGGEVHVIGVHPQASGRGVGRTLLQQGLSWLQSQGLTRVHLYVEATSGRAVSMYESASFVVVARDGQYIW